MPAFQARDASSILATRTRITLTGVWRSWISARGLGPRGRRFKSDYPDHILTLTKRRGVTKIVNTTIRINEEIKARELRVISESGAQLGVLTRAEALKAAVEEGKDLVEISPNAEPPVAKVIDWGKYQYQKTKEQQRNRRSSRSGGDLKQIKIGLKIGENDLNIKLKKINEFLSDGDKVKIMIVFKGREMAHQEIGTDLLNKIIDKLSETAVVEGKPSMAGRNLSVMVRRK